MHNAAESMSETGTLTIRGGRTHDLYEVWLQFTDTGHGMPRDIQGNLFTPFFTTKRDHRGMGIGLWLSKLYLQTLGGDIEVASALHQGSTFTIRLPATQETLPPSNSSSTVPERTNTFHLNTPDLENDTPEVLVVGR